MITFFILTLFALIGTASFAKVIYFSIQQGQWIDSIFGWQKMLERVSFKSGAWNSILYKALGGCEFCFSHFISLLCFVFYVVILHSNEFWPSFETTMGQWAFNIGWYFVFIPTSTVLSSLVINRL